MTYLTRLLTEHPNSVDESYLEHMQFAMGFAATLAAVAFCAFVHAILPFCFEKTAGRLVRQLHQRIENRA